jgi:ADP-heptose:LPS heptosyltransferase
VVKLLVFAPQGLGDSIEVTPLLRMLRQAYPSAQLDVAVLRAGPRQLFAGMPHLVDRVLYLPYWEQGVAGFVRAVGRHAFQDAYDCSFMAYPAARAEYHFLAKILRARQRIAHRYSNPSLKNGLNWYTDLVPIRDVHNVLRNVDLLAPLKVGGAVPERCEIPGDWCNGVRDRGRIAMHVGSVDHDGFALKRWPAKNFGLLGSRLTSQGFRISLICGPDEEQLTQEVAAAIPGATIFRGPLREVSRHLSTCALLVANDSGIGHLAAAGGTPVVALLGPTPLNCAPYGQNVLALRPTSCPPCFTPAAGITGCIAALDFACLRIDLSVEVVEQACMERLAHLTGTASA